MEGAAPLCIITTSITPYNRSMIRVIDRLWHQRWGHPYHLARVVDEGSGTPVVLLHGIGQSGRVWQVVVEQLSQLPCRIVAFDLLGFGGSPKPDWPEYTVDDHAQAVITALEDLKADEPAILVGHSMGCLVAVHVAKLRPDLVRHLVLYEMPLYKGLPEKLHYRFRLNLYAKFFKQIMAIEPTFNPQTARLSERMANRIAGFQVTPETWTPFVKSLEHTILAQTTAEDIKQLPMPMDVIYGRLDMFVIRGKPQHVFGSDATNIKAHTIRARHVITERAARFLTERITAVLDSGGQITDVVG
jgi:cis-3-alkyl-4-acyloxetan-2-one decarboxylase